MPFHRSNIKIILRTAQVEKQKNKNYNFGSEGRLNLSLFEVLPFDVPEEGVVLDGLLATMGSHAAKALVHVLLHELESWKNKR